MISIYITRKKREKRRSPKIIDRKANRGVTHIDIIIMITRNL